MENVKERIIQIITPYVGNKEMLGNITEETDLLRDLKINSANIIDIVLDAEKEFNITIEDEEIEKMGTIGNIMEMLARKSS